MASPTTGRRLGLIGNTALKAPCDCATTANITLNAEQTIDGVTTSESRVFVKHQTTTADNGIYDTSSGSWTRARDFNGAYDIVEGTIITVNRGSTNADTMWRVTNVGTITLGTTGLTFERAIVNDASSVGFLQAGTGAVTRTVQDKERDFATPADFGAVGDGTTNDTAALILLFAAKKTVNLGGYDKSYKINAPITILSGTTIQGDGATITQTLAQSSAGDAVEIFNVTSKTDIKISGVNFVGVGTDYIDNDNCRACAIYGATAQTRISVFNNKFTTFGYTPVRFVAATDCEVYDNIIVGPGAPTLTAGTSGRNYGVLFDSGSVNCRISGNTISKCAQGVRVEIVNDLRIENNRIFDIVGQHGIYAGSTMRNLAITGNVIYDTDLCGIKVQATSTIDSINVAITGNVIHTAGDQGILLTNGTAGTGRVLNASIVGNVVYTTVGSGINVQYTKNATVVGNTVQLAAFSAINIRVIDNVRISDNVLKSSGLSAIRDDGVCNYVTFANNTISDCCTAATGGDQFGIYNSQGGTDWTITGNILSDASAKMQYGIYLLAGTLSTFIVSNNFVNQATDAGLRLGTPAAFRSMQNNYWGGTLGPAYNDQVLPTMTPAATTAVVPFGTDVVLLAASGTAMTTIPATGHAGRTIRFVCVGVSTFTDGGNLFLAGNFSSSAADVFTLTCDGTNWYEVSRSIN